jgi:hypothetical protein
MSIGLAIALAPGAAQAFVEAPSFGAKLRAVHDAIASGQLAIDPISRAPSATDDSHAVKRVVAGQQWSQGFNKGFAQ